MSTAIWKPRTPRVNLVTSTSLPGAGAYSDPTLTEVDVPKDMTKALIYVTYTRASGQAGAASHKVYLGNGTELGQALGPDGTYAAIAGAVPSSDTAIQYVLGPIDVSGGPTKIALSSAEVGATATPGTVMAGITFS